MSVNKSYTVLTILLFLTLLSGLVLSSSSTYADDSKIDDVSIMIPTSCTLTGIGNDSHNATVNNGTYVTDIGKTTLKVFCNDSSGFSIYAIGFTGDAYTGADHTKLIGASTGSKISTGTATGSNSNNPSNWAMKLTKVTDTSVSYQPNNLTITNGYSNYSVVPDTYTKVATYSSVTDRTLGSKLETTYAAFMTSVQAADTYSGKVKYTLVHPAANLPNQPYSCSENKICYWPNGGDIATNGVGVPDTMGDQTKNYNNFTNITSNMDVNLWPSNFKRPGYGFAGWSDAYDYVINVGSESNPDAHIYGPNETIHLDDMSNGLSLYAVWVPSSGFLQNWTCPSDSVMPIGKVIALTDQRDNDTYAIARLADSKCWMIENLRLDYDNTDNSTGALAQGYGTSSAYGDFVGLAQPETANFIVASDSSATDSTEANSLYFAGTGNEGNLGATIDIFQTGYAGYRIPRYRNDNTNTNSSINPNTNTANMTGADQNVYGYGNYYSWAAAKASTRYFANATNSNAATTSLCPSGWRLPTGTGSGDFGVLSNNLGGYKNGSNVAQTMTPSTTPTGADMSKVIRSFPNNFVNAGYLDGGTVYSRGYAGGYWLATAYSYSNAYLFYFYDTYFYPGTGGYGKYSGRSIRCVTEPNS